MAATSILLNKRGIEADCRQGSAVTAHLPFFYAVHLNQACNQKCVMCAPHGNHRRDLLPFADFVALFEQIRGVAEHITLIGGEPFMYPWIDDVLALLARHPIAVTINTNLTLLPPRIERRLLTLHELHLKCSVDGATPAIYQRVRGGDVFDRVVGNLRRFSRAAAGNPRMKLILIFVVMRENLADVLPFVELARSLQVERVEFHPVRHVTNWRVDTETGWRFDGREQSCESFADEYDTVMRAAAARCESLGVSHEVQLLG
jgi:MoaA/NifB/PqqE/SkfB family radical SAM enzyme